MEKYSNANKTMSLKLKLLFFILILISQFSLYAKTDSKGNDSTQSSNQKIEQIKEDSFNSFSKWTILTKDLLNIAFFLTASIVTVLTYISAKKTILQPLKTEVLKKQINYFISLNYVLDEYKYFDFGKIIMLNTLKYLCYNDKCKEVIEKESYFVEILSSNYSSMDIEPLRKDIINKDEIVNGVLFRHSPQYYYNGEIVVSDLFLNKDISDMETNLFKLVKNPIIPKKIKPKVSKVQSDFMDSLKNKFPVIFERKLNDFLNHLDDEKALNFNDILFFEIEINNLYCKTRINHDQAIDDLKEEIYKYLKIEKIN